MSIWSGQRLKQDRKGRRAVGGLPLAALTSVAVLATGLIVAPMAAPAAAAPGPSTRVSTDAAGGQATGPSRSPALSADGQYVAFISSAPLVSADTNAVDDIYRKDRSTGAIELVSVSDAEAPGDGASGGEQVAMSDDGTKIAFRSEATNLAGGDTNAQTDLFLRDLVAGTTTRVNVNNGGAIAGLGPDFFSVSADGNKIAFISYTSLDGNPGGAYVRNIADGTTTFIHAAGGGQVAISGDGTKVAFFWSAANAYEIYLHDDADPVLYRINFGPSTNYGDAASLLGPDAMSYDGNIIAFLSDGDDYGAPGAKPRAVYAYDHVARQIDRMSELADGTDGNQASGGITNDFPKGAVSGDGTKVAFTSQATNLDPNAPSGGAMVKDRISGAIQAASLAGDGTAKPVANTTLSSDGTVVGFASGASNVVANDTNGASDVFVSADTGTTPPIATQFIAFTSNRTGNREIYRMAPDGSDLRQLTSHPGVDSDPAISPDGSKIAWVSDRPEGGGNDNEVWIADSDGSNPVNLSDHPGQDADPAWSPDGTKVAFASTRTGTDYDVWVKPIAPGALATNVTRDSTRFYDGFPSFSPDGNQIVFRSGHFAAGSIEIVRIGVDGSNRTVLAAGPGDDDRPDWSPDGSRIAFSSTRSGTSRLYVMSAVDGSGQTPVIPTSTSADNAPAWSPDGTSLVYESSAGGGPFSIKTVLLDGSNVQTLTPPSPGNSFAPDWAGTAEVEAPTLTVSQGVVEASPSHLPFGSIPTQENSPATQEAVRTSGLQIPSELVPLQITSELVPLQITSELVGLQIPSELVPLQITSELVPLQITSELVGLQIPSELVPLQITSELVPAAVDRLEVTPFSALSFNAPASAKAILDGSRFEGRPFQEFSVYDVATDSKTGPRLRGLPFGQVDLSVAFGDVGLGTLLLGSTRFADIKSAAVDVCATLEGLGRGDAGECGGSAFAAPGPDGAADARNGLSARPVDLALADIPFNDEKFPLNLHLVKMGEIALASDAALLAFDLARPELLRTTNFGSIKVADLPDATRTNRNVIDCSADRCVGETTLYEALQAGTLLPGFELRHLGPSVAGFTLGQVIFGLAGAASVPYGDFTTDQLGILGYQGPDTQRVVYTAGHQIPIGAGGSVTLKLDLPPSFAPLAGAGLSVDGGPAEAPVVLEGPTSTSFEWTLDAPAGASLVATVPMAPGVYVGEHRADLTVTSAAGQLRLDDVAPVRVVENNEPDDTPDTATPITTNTLHIGHAAGVDYYSIDVPSDELVDIVLNNRESGDNDIVVYHPINAAGVRPEDQLVATTSNEPTVIPLSETGNGNRFGEPIAGGTAQDIPLLDRPVAAIGDTRGRVNERVSFRSLAVPGAATSTYIVQVTSYLSQASSGPYTLFATSRPAPRVALACPARTGVNSGTRPTAARQLPVLAVTTKTLFLVNQDRLGELYGDSATEAFLARVDALAADPKVKGKVVPLDANADVRTKMAAWDAVPCDPLRANAVLRAGHDVIDSLIAGSGADIRHIVLLGGSEVLPKGYLPDATQTGNESQFQSELGAIFNTNNGLVGSGQNIASDDAWAAVEARAYGPRFVYPPVRAVARLVETLSEMRVPIDHFLDPTVKGSLDRTTSATFGGYFMKDLATSVSSALAGPNPTATTVSRHKLDATDSWTSSSLRSVLSATSPPSLLSFHTHANPFGVAAPGDPATPFRTSDLEAVGAKLKGKVLLTIGCHSGTTVADVLFTGANVPEFAQAATRNGALFVGQTGYGLGLSDSLAFSERLMTYLAEEIARSRTIGEAFVAAKQRYLAAGLVSPYDEKALAELSLNGLSMFDFGSTEAPPAPPSQAQAAGIDPFSGLPTATVSLRPTLRKVTHTDGVYYESGTAPTPLGLGEVSAAPERPLVPKVMIDVTQPSGVARSAWTTERTYAESEDVDPVIAAATLAGASASTPEPQPSDVVYPVVPVSLTSYDHVTAGKRQQLTLLPSQFTSTGKVDGKTVGRLRNTVTESLTVFYGPEVLSDTTPPAITNVAAVKQGQSVRFVMSADDPESDVVRASVLFEDSAGTHYVELTKMAGSWTGESDFAGTEVRVEFRALNGQGLIGRAVDKSFGFLAVTAPPAPAGIVAQVIDSTPDSDGYYGDNAKVELSATDRGFEYRLNEDPTWHPYSGPVPVGTPGWNQLSYRVSDGTSGVVIVPVAGDFTPPDITIAGPLDGTVVKPGTVLTLNFSCSDPSDATCSADVAGRTNLASGQTFSVPAGRSSVRVVATDRYGNQSWKAVSVTGTFEFEGFLAPVVNGALNRVKAGRTIPLKWRLHDAAGEVKTLDVVGVISSRKVICDTSLIEVAIPDLLLLGKENLSYDGEQYHYGWKTLTTWSGQCRDFRVALSDGSEHTVAFKFI